MGHSKERLLLALILLLACGLRLWDLGCVEFKYDEANASLWALEIGTGRYRPMADGSTSFGFANPPLYLYLFALPTLLWKSPLALVAFAGGLNVLAVLGTYLFSRRFFPPQTALVAAFLYALNPWAILLGRKVWVHILPLFSVLLLYAACELAVKRKPWALSLFLLFLGLQSQMHVMTVLAGPAALAALVSFRRKIRPGPLLLGLVLFSLLCIPYGMYVLRYGADILAGLSRPLGAGTRGFDASALRYTLWLSSGANLQALLGPAASTFSLYSRLFPWLELSTGLLLALGLAWTAYLWARRQEGYQAYLLVAAWLLGPVVLLSWGLVPVYPHYFTIVYPAPFLIMALPLGKALSASRRWMSMGALALLLAMGGVQVAALGALYGRVQAYDTTGGFGVPLKFWQRLADLAKAEARARSTTKVYSFVKGTDFRYAEMPAILRAVLEPGFSPLFIGLEEGHRLLVLPPEKGAVYMVPPNQPHICAELERFGLEVGRVVLPGGEREGRVYVLTALSPQGAELLAEREVSAEFENGVRLVGYDLPWEARPGDEVSLALYWSFQNLGADLAGREYVVFSHLVDEAGRKWTQRDGFGWPTYEWRKGEVVVAWYRLQLPRDMPPGRYVVLVGMYDWRDGQRSPLKSEPSRPAGDAVGLGPILVKGELDG